MTSSTQSTTRSRPALLLGVLLCAGLASACGLKGDLYLEDRDAAETAAPAVPAGASEETDRDAEDEDADGPADATQGG
jgi:predicted small lipoprotein YifL